MKTNILSFFLLVFQISFSQVSESNTMFAKEYSKDIALFKAKQYLMNTIIKTSDTAVKFHVTPLAASSSGHLTTLFYKCYEKKLEGLILGFYGNYWNDEGVLYQGYAFKNFDKMRASEFLKKIESNMKLHKNFLTSEKDNNNIMFRYDGVQVMIYIKGYSSDVIRLFWGDFDAIWEETAFERSKRRFEKKFE